MLLAFQCIVAFKPSMATTALYTANDILYAICTSMVFVGLLLVGSTKRKEDTIPAATTGGEIYAQLPGAGMVAGNPNAHMSGKWSSAQGTTVSDSVSGYGYGNGDWTPGHPPMANGWQPVQGQVPMANPNASWTAAWQAPQVAQGGQQVIPAEAAPVVNPHSATPEVRYG
jgi:hypothetical protein